jgi:hypothetical protein
MSEELLFEDWKRLVSFLPEERIVQVCKNVDAKMIRRGTEEEMFGDIVEVIPSPDLGDLILTNKRLIHLKHRYEIWHVLKGPIGALKILVAFFILALLIATPLGLLFGSLWFFLSLMSSGSLLLPTVVILFSLFLLLLSWRSSKKKRKKEEVPRPTGYEQVKFEIPLDGIVNIEGFSPFVLRLKLAHKRDILNLNFLCASCRNLYEKDLEQRKQEVNEFRKNLSTLLYEAQHPPREIISYNIVVEFSLGRDGTISVKCPYCGASDLLHSKESEATCRYCGKKYIIPKKILDLIK